MGKFAVKFQIVEETCDCEASCESEEWRFLQATTYGSAHEEIAELIEEVREKGTVVKASLYGTRFTHDHDLKKDRRSAKKGASPSKKAR